METLLRLQIQAVCGELDLILLDKSLPHGVYTLIEEIRQNVESTLLMLNTEESEKTGLPECTFGNTMVATVNIDGILELIFQGKQVYQDKTERDPKSSIISEMLDTAALHCNNSEVEFIYVKVNKKFLNLSAVNISELLERMAAFSATTNTIAILPPDILMQMKVSNK